MNSPLSWLIVLGLVTAGISACDKTEVTPLPKIGAGEVKQQASEAVGAVQNAATKEKDAFVATVENDVQATKAKIGDLKSRITNATGKAKAAIIPMIKSTTSSSIMVKPDSSLTIGLRLRSRQARNTQTSVTVTRA